jgi:hypothetical protein
MRLNSTVVLTLILLTLMVGAGITSATVGYRLGREALKGITQPDARPINKLADSQGKAVRREGLIFLKETDIVANVKARMDGGGEPSANGNANQNAAPAN